MKNDIESLIPRRCLDCPAIAPTFDEYVRLKTEFDIVASSSRLSEYVDDIDRRVYLDEKQSELDELAEKLRVLHARTVGCAGIAGAMFVHTRDGFVKNHNPACQSPLD